MRQHLLVGAGALLQPHQVDLYQGATVTVPLHVSSRRANESDVTAGAVADTGLVCTIDAEAWDDVAGRPPQKGDVVHWAGVRRAVGCVRFIRQGWWGEISAVLGHFFVCARSPVFPSGTVRVAVLSGDCGTLLG
jgi:hypothetical protein